MRALEREVEPRRADERLRVQRRLAAAHLDVVAVEGDVDGAERDLGAGELLDQPPQPLGEGDAARVDADERDLVEPLVALDDLVGDAVKGALERLCVEQHPLSGGRVCRQLNPTPFRPLGTGLKEQSGGGYRSWRTTG